jgi:uncharacterized protein with von Willebrand factor type A (vWA) domain
MREDPASIVPLELAVGLTTLLHQGGVPVTPERAARFAEALPLAPPYGRQQLYWTARVTLVSDRSQLAVFDALFAAVFDGRLDPSDSRGDPTAPPAIGSEPRERPAARDNRPVGGPGDLPEPTPRVASPGAEHADEDGPEREAVLAAASTDERLRETSFADLDPEDVAGMRRLVRRLVLSTPLRRTRRSQPLHHAGERLDMRRTVRAAQRTAGDPAHLVYRRRRRRPRQLVLLCDISGSMEPYTRVFLSLLQGAVTGAGAEAFVFSTRLTRLTRQLSLRDPDQALTRAGATAPDWAGGTRLADSLHRFLDSYGRRGLARGAVVVILSDGWAQDDPELVSAQMARLRLLAHRIVWVNPRKAARGYAPLVGGMAAALPYCDAFVSGHSLAALEEVVAAVGADDSWHDERKS